jgi:hypothetical protein
MNRQEALQVDLAYWIEEAGYGAVLEALAKECLFWATAETPLEGTTGAQWQQRYEALTRLRQAEP